MAPDSTPATAATECSWGRVHTGEMYEVRGCPGHLRESCAKHLCVVVREVVRVYGKAIVLNKERTNV